MITFCLYKKWIKPPVFQSSAWKDSESSGMTSSSKTVKQWQDEQQKGESGGHLGDRLTCNRCGNVREQQTPPCLCFATHQLRKIFYTKAFSWFFEMGLVTWKLFLKIQKYMWLKYSRNMWLIKSSRATGYPIPYPHVGCTNPNIECTNICLIYTLSQSNQPRGLLAEFSVLPIDPDFLQGIVYEVFWRHCLVIVKELSFTFGSLK